MKPAPSTPAPPVIDPDEEKLPVREQALKQKEERLTHIHHLPTNGGNNPLSVAVASTFAFCILRNKIDTNLKIFEEIAEA
jgi:ribonuclease HIII